jgi:hypothetical protein
VNSKRISVNRAHATVTEDIAAEDWHEQLLVSVELSNSKPTFDVERQSATKEVRYGYLIDG